MSSWDLGLRKVSLIIEKVSYVVVVFLLLLLFSSLVSDNTHAHQNLMTANLLSNSRYDGPGWRACSLCPRIQRTCHEYHPLAFLH